MKTVLITGANKGIGFETAKQLAQSDYFVFLGSRDKHKGDQAIKKLNDLGITNVATIVIDIVDIESIRGARQELEHKIGSLDILINNAGVGGSLPQEFATLDLGNLRKIFDTNFFGTIQTTQQFLPLLRKSARASIINISSEVGSLGSLSIPGGSPGRDKFHAYGSSKTALNAFTVMLANELRDTGISVNSVTPGHTATDLNQFQATRTVEQGAAPIVKLATELHAGIAARFFKENGEALW